MKDIKFEGANQFLETPPENGTTDKAGEGVYYHFDPTKKTATTCWELTEEELATVLQTRRIFIRTFSPNGALLPHYALTHNPAGPSARIIGLPPNKD